MKRYLLILLSLISLSACVRIERGEILDRNKKSFEEYFQAEIDSEQDWNVVERDSVSVVTSGPSDIKIFAYNGFYYSCVGNFEGLNGKRTLTFDALKNIDRVLVANMTTHTSSFVEVGGTMAFDPETKAAVRYDDGDLKVEIISDWTYSTLKTTKAAIDNNPVTPADYENVRYYAHQDFTVTPLFWDELNGNVEIGVFYYSGDTRVEKTIYQRLEAASEPGGFYQFLSWGNWQELWDSNYPSWLREYDRDAENNIRAKSIHATLQYGTEFGFYIKTSHLAVPLTVYSDALENEKELQKVLNHEAPYQWVDSYFISQAQSILTSSCCVMSEYQGKKFLRFECFNREPKNYDSMVFAINDAHLVPVYDVPTPWTITIEDMGSANDYDFNDVVLVVSHNAGETTAHVKLVAAGCAMDNYLWYKGAKIGEVHELLGIKKGDFANTHTKDVAPYEFDIDVPADYTVTSSDMGGIMVSNALGSVSREQYVGGVPYMICVPCEWNWPVEGVRIHDAYPDFPKWVEDHTKADTWFKNYVDDPLIIVK